MPKTTKRAVLARLQIAARLSRTALAAQLVGHGFYAGQDRLMLALADSDGQSPGQLAKKLGLKPPTVTKTINRLQNQGFLDKQPSRTDARQSHVFLTPAGHGAIGVIEKSIRRTEKHAFKGLDNKDRKALNKLLGRIEANLLDGVIDREEDDAEELEML